MKFEWDQNKATSNSKKHGIDFADAVLVFEDPLALTIVDESSAEERFVTLGLDGQLRLVVVVYKILEDTIRIISARKATRHESKQYKADI